MDFYVCRKRKNEKNFSNFCFRFMNKERKLYLFMCVLFVFLKFRGDW